MKISNEFSGLSYCLIIKVHVLSFYRSSLTSVPQYFLFVKRFFELFLNSIFSNICVFVDSFHSITPKSPSVNTFFELFFSLFFKYFLNIIPLYLSHFFLPHLVGDILCNFLIFRKKRKARAFPHVLRKTLLLPMSVFCLLRLFYIIEETASVKISVIYFCTR